MEINRHNIFELIGGRQNLYHSAILTSYTFDPIFFESYFLPKLRLSGISNIVVFLDASNYDQMLLQYPSFGLESDRRQYTLVRQLPSNGGVFHPKISLLVGEDAGMLVVGSGNLTYNGQGLNEEIWNTFSLKGENSPYSPIFHQAWLYLSSLNMPDSMLLKQQLKWMTENSNWLKDESGVPNFVTIGSEHFQFISNNHNETILSQLQKIIGNDCVNSIEILAPFYDTTGNAVKTLHELFNPTEVKCVFSEDGLYPYDLIKSTPEWLSLYSWNDLMASNQSSMHKLHAKIMQVNMDSKTILIAGSANMTSAALNGKNDEACIAIISNIPKDYIKSLGINLDNKSAINNASSVTAGCPQTTISSAASKNLNILSAEIVDDSLSVILNKPAIINHFLRVLDNTGKILEEITLPTTDSILRFRDFTHSNCMVVIIDNSNMEISNRSFVISENDVARLNPNKVLCKLNSLLESTDEWKNNLPIILSYLWFDDKPKSETISLRLSANRKEKETLGKSIREEDFDKIRIGSRQSILSLPHVRILDFILSSERKQREGKMTNNSDEIQTLEDIDSGNNEYQNSEYIIDSKKKAQNCAESIDIYGRKLRKQYDAQLTELFSKDPQDIFNPDFHNATQFVNVADYSLILIDIVLIWQELSSTANGKFENLRQNFIQNLGKFLLYSRKGYAPANNYAWHKCVEFHKELIVFSLLIIASQKWAHREIRTINLLILNLLNSTAEASFDIDEINQLFSKKLAESHIDFNSLSLIYKAMEEYRKFNLHRTDDSTLKYVDLENPNNNYSYRRGFGFFHVTDIKTVQQTSGKAYETTLHHPGFNNPIKFLGGRKIRTLTNGL